MQDEKKETTHEDARIMAGRIGEPLTRETMKFILERLKRLEAEIEKIRGKRDSDLR